LLRKAN